MRGALLAALLLAGLPAAAVADQNERLEKIRAEIEEREARARDFSKRAEGQLGALEAIDRQLVETRRSLGRLRERKVTAEEELVQARAALSRAEAERASLAKAAKARKNVQLEIKVLLRVTTLPKKLPDVKRARGRLDEIDAAAKAELAEANGLTKQFLWEDALDRLVEIQKLYAGLPTSLRAGTRRKELMKVPAAPLVCRASCPMDILLGIDHRC